MRDDFPLAVKEVLAKRVAQRCSNPGCRKPTSGPKDNPVGVINIGVAAHITAASPAGPRFDATLTPDQRRAHENGIWLCQSCAKLVDSDAARYTPELLRAWKIKAEQNALADLERSVDIPSAVDTASADAVNLSLFDRRYVIYKAIARFLASVLVRGCVEAGSDTDFLRSTEQAHFLFPADAEIKALLGQIHERAARLHAIQAKEKTLSGRALEINVDKQTELLEWFQETFRSLQSRFDKYLRVGP